MQNESQPAMGFDPVTGQPLPVAETPHHDESKKPIAPVWHTALIVFLILGNSFLGSSKEAGAARIGSRLILYSGTFVFELILFLLIWFWIRKAGVSMRQLIGGRWDSVEDFLLDVGIAAGFFIVAGLTIAGIRIALGSLDITHMSKQVDEIKRTLGPLIPRNALEASCFLILSIFAGLFEEIIFRGYLQRQLGALLKNAYGGIVSSAALFGAAHGYQGGRMMIAIGVYGALFGLLAHFRKSLRPGMIAHAIQDGYSGLALFFLFR